MDTDNKDVFDTIEIIGEIDIPKGLSHLDFLHMFQDWMGEKGFYFDGLTTLKDD